METFTLDSRFSSGRGNSTYLRHPKLDRMCFLRWAHETNCDPSIAPIFTGTPEKQGQMLLEDIDDG